ncbi:uncharacterized protein METZ01_LOCUS442479, partial [marine metagenome]
VKNQNVRDKIHRRSSARIQLEREALYSPAMRDLNTANAVLVYIDFLSRRRFEKTKSSRKSKAKWKFVNNGEIVYTYAEAEDLGMSQSTFNRAIDSLIYHGFIDIEESGVALYKCATKYRISEGWRQWGTPSFIKRPRP